MCVPEIIHAKMDSFGEAEDRDEYRASVEEVISDLEALASEKEDYYIDYLLGFCWYCHPDRETSVDIEKIVEKLMFRVLEQAPYYSLAWVYLGYNAYDFCRYNQAKERYSRADLTQLDPSYQLKVHECLLCCNLHLQGIDECWDEFENYVSIIEKTNVVDLWPCTLARALSDYSGKLDPSFYRRVMAYATRIDAAGQSGEWFRKTIEAAFPDGNGS